MAVSRTDDEMTLIDLLRDQLPAQRRREVLDRLESDRAFRKLAEDLKNVFAAMDLTGEYEPPEDLADRTLARIRQMRRTEALLAREEARRGAAWPTFSLRELSVAAAAVIIMAVVLVPSVRRARSLAVIGKCASNVGQIGAGMLAYANANDDYLPRADGRSMRWLPLGSGQAFSNSSALYKLIRSGYVSPLAFRCPAGGEGTFRVTADMTDFPAKRYISYSYQHSLGPTTMRRSNPMLARSADKMVILADSTPIFVDGRFRRDRLRYQASDNHGRTGQNVLYLDMHVAWARRPTVGVQNDNIFLVKGISEYRGDEQPSSATDSFLLPTFSGKEQYRPQ